jgi:hypothetical protein
MQFTVLILMKMQLSKEVSFFLRLSSFNRATQRNLKSLMINYHEAFLWF